MRARAEFQEIQAAGRRVNTASFVLLLSFRPGNDRGPRLGVTASKRVGNAVVRNRVKRIVRAAFRASEDLFARDLDVVAIARPSAARLSSLQVAEEWRAARARIQKASQLARLPTGAAESDR